MMDGPGAKPAKPARATICAPGVDPGGEPLGLFWFKAPNFGDALSPLVVSHVAGRPVRHASPAKAEIVALGSLMGWVHDHYKDAQPGPALPVIWGTGCLKPMPHGFLKNVDIRALRGPISGALLFPVPRRPYGDPGVFTDELLAERPAATGRIGVLAHHARADDPALAELVRQNPEVELIDVRSEDALAVIRRIAACRFILSSSLHGLIVADALGIPNHWLDPRGNHKFPELKFYDYATSIGRDLGQPLALADAAAFLRGALPTTLPYADGVAASKEALRAAFPEQLRQAA